MTFSPPSVSLPYAVLLSLLTAAAGGWVGIEKTQAALTVRMDDAEKHIEAVQVELKGYVPAGEYSISMQDLKRELDEIRSDVKEIRRGIRSR